MQFYKVISSTRTTTATAFGVCDERGREVGVSVTLWSEVWLIDPDTTRNYGHPVSDPNVSEGTKLCARVQMTRAGTQFGASQSAMRFAKATDRDAYVAKRLADSRKQATKKYA